LSRDGISRFWRVFLTEAVKRKPQDLDFQSELIHLRDYFMAQGFDHLFNNPKLTFQGLLKAADQWTEELWLTEQSGEEAAAKWFHGVPLVVKDTVVAVNLNQGESLYRESQLMRHCVRSYVSQCVQGQSLIYHLHSFPDQTDAADFAREISNFLNQDGKDWNDIFTLFKLSSRSRQATLELARARPSASYAVNQIKGFADINRPDFKNFGLALATQLNKQKKSLDRKLELNSALPASSPEAEEIPF
jgi:hypothetical protein